MEKRDAKPKKKGEGEAAGRRRGLEEGGGQPLTKELADGQMRGADGEGRHTTGTHGGPRKNGSERNR